MSTGFDFDIISLARHVPLMWYEKCKHWNPDEVGDATIDWDRKHAEAVFQEQYKDAPPEYIKQMTNGELCGGIIASFNNPTHLIKSILPRGFGYDNEIVAWFRYVVYRTRAINFQQTMYTIVQSETDLYFKRKDEEIIMYGKKDRLQLIELFKCAKKINRFVIVPIGIST